MYFDSEGVRTEHVRGLSEFAEGNVKSEIVKNVTCVICKADVMFEHFKIKASRTQPSPCMSF